MIAGQSAKSNLTVKKTLGWCFEEALHGRRCSWETQPCTLDTPNATLIIVMMIDELASEVSTLSDILALEHSSR
jgi:hypothetical protein